MVVQKNTHKIYHLNIQFIHIVMQQISATFLCCKTETLHPFPPPPQPLVANLVFSVLTPQDTSCGCLYRRPQWDSQRVWEHLTPLFHL